MLSHRELTPSGNRPGFGTPGIDREVNSLCSGYGHGDA